MTIKIDKDVPMPIHGQPSRYPFSEMDSGDSFALPNMKRENANQLYTLATKHSIKVRISPEGEGVRVWRKA